MIEGLADQPRLILKAQLAPVVGSAFQPTGFPDLGAAEFQRPMSNGSGSDGLQTAVLVESVQSLANHLEGVGWDTVENRPTTTLSGLPYVEVRDQGKRFLTSSRLEPHRLAGAYIKNAAIDGKQVGEWMVERLGVQKGVPLDWKAIYAAIFQLDPLCLLHGVFFSDPLWRDYGNPKVRRAITAVIEAHGARPVVSGGVKRDDVYPTTDKDRNSKEGYGFVPFGRTEYTARAIELDVAIDLEQIRGYGLGAAASDLLVAVALWEVRTLLDRPLRLRTACDLEVQQPIEIRRPEGYELPSAAALAEQIQAAKVDFNAKIPHSALFG
jgi:CRISPR-associated protein Csb1